MKLSNKLRPVNQHTREVDVEVVVGSHATRKYLHPHVVPLPHSHHGGLREGVVLKVVGVVAAGNDGAVVADQQEAVVALHGKILRLREYIWTLYHGVP